MGPKASKVVLYVLFGLLALSLALNAALVCNRYFGVPEIPSNFFCEGECGSKHPHQ